MELVVLTLEEHKLLLTEALIFQSTTLKQYDKAELENVLL